MEEIGDKTEISKTISYDIPDSAVVFRLAWYAVASKPGVLLNEYSEAESQIYKGKAIFSSKDANVRVWVEEAQRLVEITGWSEEQAQLESYLEEVAQSVEASVKKYQSLTEEEKGKLKRALVAKTCWDKIVFEILNKAPAGAVYFQLAHGREMIIKATEGEEIHALPLTTSGWLSRIEAVPRDEVLPSGVAMELAKKSVEWKKETQDIIARYI
ncbi:MAG: putative selenocysteine system protein [Candidatus Thorarchaeota archaeon]